MRLRETLNNSLNELVFSLAEFGTPIKAPNPPVRDTVTEAFSGTGDVLPGAGGKAASTRALFQQRSEAAAQPEPGRSDTAGGVKVAGIAQMPSEAISK